MAHEIELVGDGDGVLVVGDRSTIERFLDHAGLLARAEVVNLGKISSVLQAVPSLLGQFPASLISRRCT
jgi:hypothetical protein